MVHSALCFVADQYWDKKGPIFFYTGNEGPITGFWDNSGFVLEAAQKFNALVIFGEHVSTQGCFMLYSDRLNTGHFIEVSLVTFYASGFK